MKGLDRSILVHTVYVPDGGGWDKGTAGTWPVHTRKKPGPDTQYCIYLSTFSLRSANQEYCQEIYKGARIFFLYKELYIIKLGIFFSLKKYRYPKYLYLEVRS